MHTEIVLDTSNSMSAPFNGSSKLKKARDSIIETLKDVSDRDMLALRRYGGTCDENDATQLVVPFAQENKETISRKLQSFSPAGKATMFQAVRELVPDFNEAVRFPGTRKRVVMVIGSCEECRDNPIELIKRRIQNTGIDIEWKFVGMDLDRDCVQQLKGLAGVDFVNTKNARMLSMAMKNAMSEKAFRNLPPEILLDSANKSLKIKAGQRLSVAVSAFDPNMMTITLSASSLPDGAFFETESPGSARFIWTPLSDQVGEHSVVFKASDGEFEVKAELQITVLPMSIDNAIRLPIIQTVPSQNSYSVIQDQMLSFQIHAYDPDGAVPEIAASRLPEGAKLNIESLNTGQFTWTPGSNQVGTHTITLFATVGDVKTSKDIRIDVTPLRLDIMTLDYPGLIRFGLGSHAINKVAEQRLLELVSELKACRSIKEISITGHTCSLGPAIYNIHLGLRRAEAVKAYLIQAKIQKDLLRVKSMGEKSPQGDNQTVLGRKRNRRVDFKAKIIK